MTHAYEQLLAEGYIYTKERKGYYVENITPLIYLDTPNSHILPDDLKETWQDDAGWLSLSHMPSDISRFPFTEWVKYQQKAIRNHKKDLSEIPHFQGPYLLRKTIANMVSTTRNVVCEPEQIVIGSGTQSLLHTLIQIRKDHTGIAVEDPGYPRIYTLLKNIGLNVHTLHVDDKGAHIKHIDPMINLILVTPSHQFPTGTIMPISRRIELLNWSIQHPNRYIIEDDYDSEFKYETDSVPSLQSLDKNQRVIYTGTFSKTMFPGVRVSYMILPINLLKKYRDLHYNLIQNSNLLTLYTLHYFIKGGGYYRYLKKMNLVYASKRKVLIQQIKKIFGSKAEIKDIPGGLHFLIKVHTTYSYNEFETRAYEERLEAYSIKRFLLKKTYKKQNVMELVIGFATIQENDIPEAVHRLYDALYPSAQI